jgi:hypothetical protein
MKKGILFLLVAVASFTSKAQSLKDLLYSGKLKMDSNSVVRKTDDLKSKIDTTQKKPPVVETTTKTVVPPVNPAAQANDVKLVDSSATVNPVKDAAVANQTPAAAAAPAKTNTKLWKEYSDALAVGLKTEVLNSKKIKKDTYYFMVDYELEPNGQVTVTNVTVTPENNTLQDQVKERMLASPPQLNADPNQAKKVKRRYSFNVTKE